jgi:FAD/FMN-containing dehydrogenase
VAELAGWGNYPIQECHAYRPESVDQLAQLVLERDEQDITMRGLGRSYGDAALNQGRGVVLTERLDRMLAFDPASCVLTCEAAVSLADIIDVFLPRGFFFPVTPGSKHVTIGGAIAADVHGKNHHRDGSMSSALLDFKLLIASGEVLDCSRDQNADVFWATVGGMGLTGAILEARIQLRRTETSFMKIDYERAANLDVVLERMLDNDDDYGYTVAWIDCLARGRRLGRSVRMLGNPAKVEDLPLRKRNAPRAASISRKLVVPFNFPGFVLNPTTVGLFNSFYYYGHLNGTRITSYDPFFYPLDSIQHWNRIYGSRGVLQYQFALPQKHAREGLVEILELLPESSGVSFLAVLKSFGPAESGLLSFPMPGMTLALDFPITGPDLFVQLSRIEEIVLKHGGRVYLAKDSCLSQESFVEMYPRLDEFREVKAWLDPEQRFSSSLARRLGIVESS